MLHFVSLADEAFVPGLCVTIVSSLLYLPKTESVTFHILSGNLTLATREQLEQLAHQHHKKCDLIFHEIRHNDFKDWKPGPNNSMMTYARLLLGSLLPTVSKVLYIDSDIIVLSNLMELWNMPMNGKMILAARGGANAILSGDCPWNLTEEEKLLPYINAGIIVIDLDQWRAHSVEKQIKKIVCSDMNFTCYDQTILNYLLRHQIGLFSMDWNWQGRIFSEEEAETIHVIHFITPKKPWFWWSGDPRFTLWRTFYKKYLGSPLQLFAKQKAWSGLFYGLFETMMRRHQLLRWCYVSLLKLQLATRKSDPSKNSLKTIYDYYTTGLGGERGQEEFQNSRSVLSALLRRF